MKAKIYFLMLMSLSFCLELQAQVPNYVSTSGLQSWWPFTGNANDQSVNGFTGSVNGAVLTQDRFNSSNSAYLFDGFNDFIATNDPGILGTGDRAISVWIKTTNSSLNPMYTVAWGSNGFGDRFGLFINTGTYVGAAVGAGQSFVSYSTSPSAINGNWQHYVLQFSGNNIGQSQIYQNGVLLSNINDSYNSTQLINTLSTFSVHFGKIDYMAAPAFFDGSIDDVGIWSRTLTPCEISKLYNANAYTVGINSNTNTICAGASVTLTANGASSYTWNTSSNASSIVVSPSSSSIYTVTGTNGSCISTKTVQISVSSIPTVAITSGTTTICLGQSINLQASGASTYSWNTGSTNSTVVVSPSITTTYSVVGTNPGGCTNTKTLTINVADCTTIGELSNENESIKIYPNPNDGHFIIQTNSFTLVKIYNTLGQIVSEKTLDPNIKAEINGLSCGIYFISCNVNGKTWKQKVIVNK